MHVNHYERCTRAYQVPAGEKQTLCCWMRRVPFNFLIHLFCRFSHYAIPYVHR